MTVFSVPDMSCGHCKAAIEAALGALDPAPEVAVDLTARTVSVTGGAGEGAVLAALEAAGYPARVAG